MRSRQSNWKLDAACCARIREAVLFGARQSDLARSYGVSPATINSAVKGRTFQVAETPATFLALREFCRQPRLA